MPNTNSDESVLNFGSDSPLFSKKKVVKKKIVVPKKKKAKVNPLTSNSPLFVDKKPTAKRRGPKSHALIEEEKIIAENKRIATKRAKNEKKPKKQKPMSSVKTPQGCKHILPAFKPFLVARWKMLKGTHAEAQTVGNYIQAAARVCKDSRPQEFAELYTLAQIAKRIARERT